MIVSEVEEVAVTRDNTARLSSDSSRQDVIVVRVAADRGDVVQLTEHHCRGRQIGDIAEDLGFAEAVPLGQAGFTLQTTGCLDQDLIR